MKTAYLACFVLAAATHYYAFASSAVPPDALTAMTCVRAELAPPVCQPGARGRFIGFNSYLAH